MNKTVTLLLSTLMLAISASAMADSNRWDHRDRYEYRDDNRHRYHHHRHDHHDAPRWSNSDRGKHYGHRLHLKRGDRFPSELRSNRYVISNYRYHRLATPARGYRWMQLQDRYILVDSKYRIYRVL